MWFISFLVTLSMFILLGAWKVIYSWIFTIPPLPSPHFTTPCPPLELIIASFIPLHVSHYPSLLPNLSVGLDLSSQYIGTHEGTRPFGLSFFLETYFLNPSTLFYISFITCFPDLMYRVSLSLVLDPLFPGYHFFPLLSWLTLLFDGIVAFSPVASEKEVVR